MNEQKIKTAFAKVKQDISNLNSQISTLISEFKDIKRTIRQTDNQTDTQTHPIRIQTHPLIPQTDPKVPQEEGGFSSANLSISTGNEGVQTDRQTIRQTDRLSQKFAQPTKTHKTLDAITHIDKVSEVLNSLDTLKKDLRSQFKKLTSQEMLVFSSIYQLTDQHTEVDYALLAKKINLSESSIRDYVQKIIKKGIPISKNKENNKRVVLSIPLDFKRAASLSTIMSLRDL